MQKCWQTAYEFNIQIIIVGQDFSELFPHTHRSMGNKNTPLSVMNSKSIDIIFK